MKCPTCGHDHKGMMRLPKDIPLLPCPCCGGKAEFDDYDVENGEVLVRCVDCDLNTVPRSHEEAAAQWNRRPNNPMNATIPKPRKLNSFRALLRIFRLEKALKESRRREEGAWFNRDHYCKHINIIGTEILGPRLNSFKGGNCSPEAVSRETRKLIEKLEAENVELRRALDSQNETNPATGSK